MQKIIQITDVTLDELAEAIAKKIGDKHNPGRVMQISSSKIIVLNKREAAKVLNIGESLFDKLHARGLIPTTVISGYNRKHQPIERWCQDHIIAIKPIILKLKYEQSDAQFIQAKSDIYRILSID